MSVNSAVESALPVADRLRTSLASPAPRIDGVTLRLTASIGIAQWREPEEPSILVMRADAALYEAKQRGRDCVVVDTAETESFAS